MSLLGLLSGDGSWAGFFLSGLIGVLSGMFVLGLLSGDGSWADWSEELLCRHLLLGIDSIGKKYNEFSDHHSHT